MKHHVVIVLVSLLSLTLLQSSAAQEVKDPVKEAARKLEKQVREENYSDLRKASTELVTLSKELNDEVERSDEHVLSARIFDKIDKIEKVTRRIRAKARGPYQGLRP